MIGMHDRMADEPTPVVFDVLLRAPGRRRDDQGLPATAAPPEPEVLERCRRWLAARGVTCRATTFGLACSAPGNVFAELFRVRVAPNSKRGPEQPAVVIEGKIHVPSEIASWVEQVTVPAPPSFFR
jgi:hypothetical protein